MADNTTLPGTGDVVRDIDRAGIKTQVLQVDVGGASAESLLTKGQQVMTASLPVTIASDQSAVDVVLPWGVLDTFGHMQTVKAVNDIDIQWYRDVPANLATATSAGGGTGTQTTGLVQLATSTGTTGEYKLVSTDSVYYNSGGEIYCMFTAAWLDGGAASCNQRIGLYDTNNGMFMGYAGTVFGVSVRQNAVDTQTAKASFNVDTLVGGAGSKFTRNGTPEAIDLTRLNVFRIRFGWLGAAPVKYEVLSPDGEWVLFHVIRQPNTAATPHIYSSDLPMTAHLVKTAGATNIRMNTACWGAGSTYDEVSTYESGTLGTAANSAVTLNTQRAGTVVVACVTTTSGTMIFEATVDGSVWFTHPMNIKLSSTNFDTVVQEAQTPTTGDRYRMNASGFKAIRVRTATTLGATVVLQMATEEQAVILKQIEMVPPPHNFGYTQAQKAVTASTAQTGTAIWTPASGKRIVITSIQIQSFGTTAGTATVWFGASGDTTYTINTDYAIFNGEFAPSANSKPGLTQTGLWISPTVDYVLKYTTTNAQSINITVWGYEA